MNANCRLCIWFNGECQQSDTPIEDIETCLINDGISIRVESEKMVELLEAMA